MYYEFEDERSTDRSDVATALRAVAHGVESGTLRVRGDDEPIDLAVPETLAFEVEVEVEENEVEVELELEWETDEEHPVEPAGELGESPHDGSGDGDGDTDSDGDAERNVAAEGMLDGATLIPPAEPVSPSATDQSEDEDEEPADEPLSARIGPARLPSSLARFELFVDRADEWRWRLRHRNGNVIADSGEGYTRKRNARKGLASVVTNAPGAEIVETDE